VILSISRGDDPAGLIAYLLGNTATIREDARLVGIDNLAAFETAPKEMAYTASMSDRVRNYVLHVSVSPAPGEALSEAQWDLVWDRIDTELGLHGHQSVTVAHDEGRPHRHRGYNIIHPDTHRTPIDHTPGVVAARNPTRNSASLPHPPRIDQRAWDTNIKYRLQQLSRELEVTLGLASAVAPQRWRSRQPSQRVSAGAARQETRTGVLPLEIEYGDAIRKALRKNTWAERIADLHAIGIGIAPYAGTNARRKGVTFHLLDAPERRCTGSALGGDYGLGALERRAGQTLVTFLAQTPVTSPATVSPRAPAIDTLYQRFLAYREEQRTALETYRLRVHIAREEQRLVIDEAKRRHVAMRSAMRAAADRRHRGSMTSHMRAVERLALADLCETQKRELRDRFPRPPAPLGWSDWLAQAAERGDVAAQHRLKAIRKRSAHRAAPAAPQVDSGVQR
jgi:hypothetical protein